MNKVSYLPTNDAKLMAWVQNFSAAAAPLEGALNISPYEVAALDGLNNNFSAAVLEVTAAQAALKAAFDKKKAAAKMLNTSVRKLVERIQVSPNITDPIRQSLGLPLRQQPVPPPIPLTPANLVATPYADGTNNLNWKHNGNKQGVVYVVQAQTGGNGAWYQAGISTSARFVHANVQPGVPMKYRVNAQRGAHKSPVSNEAGVYGA